MKKLHTENQHFVSQFLLKNFSFDGKRVFVLDRIQNQIFTDSVKHLCHIKDLYDVKWKDANEQLGEYVLDNKIENYLSDLENKVAPSIRKIIQEIKAGRKSRILSATEKQLIDEFGATLYIRNPYILKSIIDYYVGVEYEPEVDNLIQVIQYLFDMVKWGSSASLFDFSIKQGTFNKEIEGSPLNVIYESFSNMKYIFWHSKDGGFLTSSFPMHISVLDDGRANRILLPLSSEIAIVFFNTIPFPFTEGSVLVIDRNTLEFNMELFFKSYSKEMARFFMAKDEQCLRRLLR